MEIKVTVDRFEGETAVLVLAGEASARSKPGARLLWPRDLLPPGATEGTYLVLSVSVDEAGTAAARDRIRGLLDALSKDRPRGGGQ